MRGEGNELPIRWNIEFGHVPFVEANPRMWFHLSEESRNTNVMLLETTKS